ncbi:MAG: type IV pilus secretin PilQ [Gammaproteobacteria bacterium]|nr:type IV pilus secretin PilQ [Gammaproteobacteria bacterium]
MGTNALKAINHAALPGDRIQLELVMAEAASEPLSFTIDNPARVALDFADTVSKLARKKQPINIGVARSVHAIEAKGRTRIVLNLLKMVPYQVKVKGNRVYLTLGEKPQAEAEKSADVLVSSAPASPSVVSAPTSAKAQQLTVTTAEKETLRAVDTQAEQRRAIRNIDFHRGEDGEGRVVVTLSDASVLANIEERGGEIVADFLDVQLPDELELHLDVVDFATPVNSIETVARGPNVRMRIVTQRDREYLAYQSNKLFVIEVKPLTRAEQEAAKKERFGYTGERLSLNFQNIEVRAVLQLIADFTGLNIVASDSVTGSITLRLKSVPWDQALDIILKAQGLALRKHGNVVMIAPATELLAREKKELEAQKQAEELVPLRSEIISINYAKAQDLANLLKGEDNSLLSERGNVAVDVRTNSLLVQDTDEKLIELRKLLTTLDVPIKQVLIESRVVIANDNFGKSLGVRFGATGVRKNGSDGIITTSGNAAGTDSTVSSAISNLQATGQQFPVSVPSLGDRMNVNLPVSSPAGQIAFAILGSDYLLDLELSAMQVENRGEIVSSPRVITSDQNEAVIEQGTEVPYITPASGASNVPAVAFKKAVLSLKVTPQITPDNRILLDLTVNKDSVGRIFNGVPSIDTKEVKTQVLVKDGETVVLGGVYEQVTRDEKDMVPFLGELPFIGVLFRQTRQVNEKAELLIFVTPRILKGSTDQQ